MQASLAIRLSTASAPIPMRTGAAVEYWNISPFLTTACGEVIEINDETSLLLECPTTHQRLVDQLLPDSSYIALKDGTFGILLVREFKTHESDGTPVLRLPARADIVDRIETKAHEIAEAFPFACIGMPDEAHTYRGRSSVWAFVPDGAASADQLIALDDVLFDLQ